MKKTILVLILLSNYIYSQNSIHISKDTYKVIDKISSQDFIENQKIYAKDTFGYIKELEKERKKKMSKEQKKQNELFINELKKRTKDMTFEEASAYIKTMYKGNEYLSKKEALELLKIIKGLRKEALKDREFILYFFSETVPRHSTTNVILDIGILRENGVDIDTKQYLRGPTKDFKSFVMDWKDFIDTYPIELRPYITNNFHLKIDPRFFKVYRIKRAPAMALAICDSGNPKPKSCKVKYLIRGNVSLEVFFDKISKYEKKYKDYVRYLQANKIVKNKKEVKRNENKK